MTGTSLSSPTRLYQRRQQQGKTSICFRRGAEHSNNLSDQPTLLSQRPVWSTFICSTASAALVPLSHWFSYFSLSFYFFFSNLLSFSLLSASHSAFFYPFFLPFFLLTICHMRHEYCHNKHTHTERHEYVIQSHTHRAGQHV